MKIYEQLLRRAVELGIQEKKDPSVRETRLCQLAELSDKELFRRTTEDLEFGARREDWARANAEEHGYRLVRASDVGLYAIIDNATGKTIEADMDADDVEYFLSEFWEDEKLTEVDRRLFDAACFATTKVRDGQEFWEDQDIVDELVKMGKSHESAQILVMRAVRSTPRKAGREIRH